MLWFDIVNIICDAYQTKASNLSKNLMNNIMKSLKIV